MPCASPRSPRRGGRPSRSSCFHVGLADRARTDRLTDEAGDGDQGDEVRDHGDEVGRDARTGLTGPDLEYPGEPEQQGGSGCVPRVPATEDDTGESDIALARTHVTDERTH